VARAKLFSLDDVFVRQKPWRKFVTDFCLRDLHDEFSGQSAPDPDRSAIESIVVDGGNWLWGADKATVHFTVYSIASFSSGEFDVDIPYDVLMPYLRPDSPPLPRPWWTLSNADQVASSWRGNRRRNAGIDTSRPFRLSPSVCISSRSVWDRVRFFGESRIESPEQASRERSGAGYR
jgi:hypothetical protein